jgi:hypothetical protein
MSTVRVWSPVAGRRVRMVIGPTATAAHPALRAPLPRREGLKATATATATASSPPAPLPARTGERGERLTAEAVRGERRSLVAGGGGRRVEAEESWVEVLCGKG